MKNGRTLAVDGMENEVTICLTRENHKCLTPFYQSPAAHCTKINYRIKTHEHLDYIICLFTQLPTFRGCFPPSFYILSSFMNGIFLYEM